MGHGDTSSGGYVDSGKAVAASFMEADGGVGVTMQDTISSNTYDNQMTSFIPYYQNDQHHHSHFGGGALLGNQMSIPTTGSGSDSGKVIFTAAQWQELERQTMIYKYIMASIPVPANLLSTQSNIHAILLNVTQFGGLLNFEALLLVLKDGYYTLRQLKEILLALGYRPITSMDRATYTGNHGLEVFSTSGNGGVDPENGWCRDNDESNDGVVQGISYRTRSTVNAIHIRLDLVQESTWKPNPTTPTLPLLVPSMLLLVLPLPIKIPGTNNSECTEWFMKMPVSTSNQQLLESMNSPKVGSKRTHIFPNEFEGNHHLDTTSSSLVDASVGARRQNFIDAWSRSGGGDNCSLTLSMQCSGGIDDDNDQSVEIGNADVLKSHNQWLNQASWMSSPPGGPLGEALGLGIAGALKGPLNLPSPHGHSNSPTTASSSCENSGSHGHELSFIR
ncbi:growth-regulating factor 8-like protein [Tanacetum coccineum]|uniref:Growth-regulating factor n=1 Tax=Tanacetum coccineum TaxID=301880 RepID=A0ABQ5I3R8_9ASTR